MAAVMLHENWEYRLLLGKERHMEEKKKMNRKRKLFPIRLFVCNDQHTLRAYMAAIFVLCVV